MRFVVLIAFVAGCGSHEINVQGRVEHARQRPDYFDPLAGGTVRILDSDGVPYSTATTKENGFFRAKAPAPEQIFAEITADDLATSSFTGVTGDTNSGALVIPIDEDGDSPLFGVLLTQVDEIRSQYAGCPGVDDPGGIVFGEVRVSGIIDPITDQEPLVGSAEVSVVGATDDDTLTACYLDAAGDVYDPDAIVTGSSGQFAVFGVPSGRRSLSVAYSAVVDSQVVTYTDIWVPDADVAVVPRLPAWVEFPF
jgi:hypothetical protein